jgi:hypothetical protein
MSSKEDQQIQIGAMPQDFHLLQYPPSVFVFHRELHALEPGATSGY